MALIAVVLLGALITFGGSMDTLMNNGAGAAGTVIAAQTAKIN